MTLAIDRLLARCREVNGCWEFTGRIAPNGYGAIFHDRKTVYSHRLSYTFFVADIPLGLDLDHLCRNRACCNPWHLEPVTRAVNLNRSPLFAHANRSKTACPKGHAYDEKNTFYRPYVRVNGSVGHSRVCRACIRSRNSRKAAR